jgi:hypothetical protein
MGMEGVVDFDYDKIDRHDITEILLKVASKDMPGTDHLTLRGRGMIFTPASIYFTQNKN